MLSYTKSVTTSKEKYSQFKCCNLLWMVHRTTFNNRINAIHERALRVFYKNKYSFLEQTVSEEQIRHHRSTQPTSDCYYCPTVSQRALRSKHFNF